MRVQRNNKTNNLIGLSGGQGSGKSTIAKILKIILEEKYKMRVINFSIDDGNLTINLIENPIIQKIQMVFLLLVENYFSRQKIKNFQ